MIISQRFSIAVLSIVITILATPLLLAQNKGNLGPTPPVPTQIGRAKKVFISNAGGNEPEHTIQFFRPNWDPDETYNRFYAALSATGRYETVLAPSDADLILQIKFGYGRPLDVGSPTEDPQLRLTILDPKTQTLLWAFSKHVERSGGPHWKEKSDKKFDAAIAAIIEELARLATRSSR
jgi:hypothetical protein